MRYGSAWPFEGSRGGGIITTLGNALKAVPMSAKTGDVIQEVNEKILDAIYALYSAHHAAHYKGG